MIQAKKNLKKWATLGVKKLNLMNPLWGTMPLIGASSGYVGPIRYENSTLGRYVNENLVCTFLTHKITSSY
jgi:hypothetical protein